MYFFRGGGVSTINLAAKWSYNPLFADKLAKCANEILLHCLKRFVFKTQYNPWGVGVTLPVPPLRYGPDRFDEHCKAHRRLKK